MVLKPFSKVCLRRTNAIADTHIHRHTSSQTRRYWAEPFGSQILANIRVLKYKTAIELFLRIQPWKTRDAVLALTESFFGKTVKSDRWESVLICPALSRFPAQDSGKPPTSLIGCGD